MSAGTEKQNIHELVGEVFPRYPNELDQESLLSLVDRAEEGIVNYSGHYSPAILHGINVLRDIRDRVSEAGVMSSVVVRHHVDTVDFHLRNNLSKITFDSPKS